MYSTHRMTVPLENANPHLFPKSAGTCRTWATMDRAPRVRPRSALPLQAFQQAHPEPGFSQYSPYSPVSENCGVSGVTGTYLPQTRLKLSFREEAGYRSRDQQWWAPVPRPKHVSERWGHPRRLGWQEQTWSSAPLPEPELGIFARMQGFRVPHL